MPVAINVAADATAIALRDVNDQRLAQRRLEQLRAEWIATVDTAITQALAEVAP